jgi:(p)ppGpp synthase/HD superfamily hydrolase
VGILQDADEFASRSLGQLRTKLGGLHIAHARRVAAEAGKTGDERVAAAALLHDVVEKTGMSPSEVFRSVPDERVMELVRILTHSDDEDEQTYLARCAADPAAYLLKRLDLLDKLVRHDDEIPEEHAAHLRDEAKRRVAQLDALRSQHAS